MPVVFVTPEALVNVRGPWAPVLEEAGFKIAFPEDPTFTRGLTSAAETIRVLQNAEAVLAGGEFFTAEVLAGLPKLRVIARQGVGYDRIDIPAATNRKIPVTITPTANHEGVAEQAFALIFAVSKGVVVNDVRMRAGGWSQGLTEPIRGKTLGLFGLGRTGRSTAIRGRALGMRLIATEMYPDMAFVREHGVELVDFDTLLARSDFLSLHCPHNPQTDRMFNRSVFAKMKRGSVLINTARGRIVVEADLVTALQQGRLAGAGLDVFEQEPTAPDNPLFALKNVVLSPHLAGADRLSQENMAIEAAHCIARLYRGDWPTGAVVNDELRTGWKW